MKPLNKNPLPLTVLAAVACFSSAPTQASENLALRWNQTVIEAVRQSHIGPPMAARALAIIHTCVYDAWAAYDDEARGTEFGSRLRQPGYLRTSANREQAISHAAYRAAVDLFPGQKALFDRRMSESGFDPRYSATEIHTPAGIGNLACAAVLKTRHRDGSNQKGDLAPGAYSDYTGYVPTNTPWAIRDPNLWQPLEMADGSGGKVIQKYLAPHWGRVKPFAMQAWWQYPVKPPARADSPAYRRQVDEVLAYSARLTDRQKAIAEYWADGPRSELPPGHWNLFAQHVSKRDRHDLDRDVKMFFALNNALMDAGIWAWGVKRHFDSARPITAVHHLYGKTTVTAWAGPGLGTQVISGAAWKPYQPATFLTPPFAEHVSGHSSYSASAATVLRLMTGSNNFGYSVTLPAGSSRVEPGRVPAGPVTLHWPTFSDAADEAGLSRLYGGIHFKDGDLEGRRVGQLIGRAAFDKSLALFGDEGKHHHCRKPHRHEETGDCQKPRQHRHGQPEAADEGDRAKVYRNPFAR